MTPLIIFDIDGTLTDSVRQHQQSLLKTFSTYGFTNLNTDWGAYRHHTDSAIFHEAWQDGTGRLPDLSDWDAHVRLHETHFREIVYKDRITEIPGAASFIEQIAKRGWGFVFATGSIRSLAEDKLSAANIGYNSQLLSTASEHQTREELVIASIRLATNYFGIEDWTATSIGDGHWDYRTAQHLSIPFVGIGHAFSEMPHVNYVRDFSDPDELFDAIAMMHAA